MKSPLRIGVGLALIAVLSGWMVISQRAAEALCGPTGSTWSNFCTTSQGDFDNYTVAIQRMLTNNWPVDDDTYPVDGDFGPGTKAGVMEFQEDQSLDDDGIVGPMTWSRLDNYLDWHDYSSGWHIFGAYGPREWRDLYQRFSSTGVWTVWSTCNGYYEFVSDTPDC